MVSSLNLAALQQANKRRRASVALSSPFSRSPSAPGGKGPGEAQKTIPVPSETGVAVGKTPAERSGSFKGGDDNVNVVGGVESNGQDVDEERTSAAPTATAASPASLTITSSESHAAEDSNRGNEEASLAGGGAATHGEGGSDDVDDGGSCAALLASNGGATFVLVAKEHLVGTWLAVFVRASMLQEVSDVRTGMYP